jgi:hypothetical protein
MDTLILPTEDFYVSTMQELYNDGQLKDHLDCLIYIQKYYFEASNGIYYFYDVSQDDFIFKSDKDFKKEVLDKLLNCKIISRAIKTNSKIYKIINNVFKPRHFQDGKQFYINSCKGFLHKNFKPFDEYPEEIKNNVMYFINFQKEVMANNDENMLKAYLTYYAQLARGMKTEVIIYKKSIQGIGKSTETDFLFKYVFGNEICLSSGTEPLTSNFNKIYMGKLLIVFEELPVFSEASWSAVSSKLKTLSTEKICVYRDVYEKSIQAENISNFQINTNVESIKDSDGRRYIIMDLNTSRYGDYKYFDSIKTKCYNLQVGEAYFSYLMTKITEEETKIFYGQRDFPETANKLITISNLLHSSFKFLKNNYLLRNLEIDKIPCAELYQLYENYCQTNNCRKCGRNDFYKRLENIQIKREKQHGEYFFNVSLEKLKDISKKYKWICEFDDYKEEEPEECEEVEEAKEDILKELNNDLYEAQQNEINELKKRLEELEKKNKKLKKKVKKYESEETEEN